MAKLFKAAGKAVGAKSSFGATAKPPAQSKYLKAFQVGAKIPKGVTKAPKNYKPSVTP